MKLFIKTFGCRANQYDSERLRALALASGAEIVDSVTSADVAVFNSCAVTTEAEADLRQAVRRAARQNPAVRSFVMGCASALELNRESAPQATNSGTPKLRSLPTVEGIFDGAAIDDLASAVGFAKSRLSVPEAQTGARALLRIQDGCDEHCTFCATTIARGANRSRGIDDLLNEAEELSDHHREIVLTGVHIGSYGTDIGGTLSGLVERLIVRVPGVRFRLSSLEATEVDDRLAELLTSLPRQLAPYLHAPLQSGSDRVLKRMGRHWYTAQQYAGAIEKLISRNCTFGLGADIIAGFPGETDADHRSTIDLIAGLPFTSLHVFSYSPRPDTAALKLAPRLPGDVVASRAAELRELARTKADAYVRARAGGIADVVVTGVRPARSETQHARTGLTEDYLPVRVMGAEPRGVRFDATLDRVSGNLTATRITI
jgi:threonylcarbamoyladenosine tRNA methylthiotransferase MtaB